jgi:hypothetical protein
MRGTFRLLFTLLALCIFAFTATSALAAKPKVKILGEGQNAILSKNSLKAKVTVKVKKGKKAKVKVKGLSSTFDQQKYSALTRTRRLTFRHSGSKTVKLPLNATGKTAVKSCQARTLRVKAGSGKGSGDLVRQTKDCKPHSIDLSQASKCDFIGQQDGSRCMLPFPDNFYTVSDPSTYTGRRINLSTASMPANTSGVHIDAAPYNSNDGFSPGQAIVLRIPGLDNPTALAKTNAVPINHLGAYTDKNAPVVVIDAKTGKRWPIWVEIDSNAASPSDTAVLIHPAKNFAAHHRYIVAMRNLKDSSAKTIAAPEGFRYYRDELPSSKGPINKQRKRFDSIFSTLKKAGIERSNLYLAWDFSVATDQNIAARMLQIRDDAFSQLGDTDLADETVTGTAPAFTVTDVDLTPNPDLARRVRGTFTVPCYMTSVGGVPCATGSRYNLDSNGVPVQNGTWTANFDCIIPHSIVDDAGHSPGRPVVYGHGLLGSADEVTSDAQRTLSQNHKFMHCATDEIGFSENDVVTAITILGEMGKFPELTDRTQQGLLDELYLGRLMDNPAGFAGVKAFHEDQTEADTNPNVAISPTDPTNPSVIDTSKLYYNGNSQGGILGGAFAAISPDVTRASLGVPAMNYSVLLNRSSDFTTYEAFLNPAYPSKITQALLLSAVQMLWDPGEANGYAHRMTDDPLPNTPPHKVLMDIAFGDHQVTTWQADVEARTIGAEAHAPVVSSGRWPGVDPLVDIPRIASYPYTGSAIVYWDGGPLDWSPGLGTDPPPLGNLPNSSGDDPHELPRRAPGEQQMVSDFLQPNNLSNITDTCSGLPCFSGTYTGP